MNRLKSITIYFSVFILVCFIGEFYLRITGLSTVSSSYPHPELGIKYLPNCNFSSKSKILQSRNSLGFFDREHERINPQGTNRVLFLGNSFVAATDQPRDERFSSRVESQLNRMEGSAGWESINMALPGIGAGISYLIYREYGMLYNPDIVILAGVVSDLAVNIKNVTMPVFSISENGELIIDYSFRENFIFKLRTFLAPIKHHSSIVSLFVRTIRRFEREGFFFLFSGKQNSDFFSEEKENNKETTLRQNNEKLEVFEAILKAFKKDILDDGGRLLFVLIPESFVVSAPENTSNRKIVEYKITSKKIVHILENNGIPVVDLTIPLRNNFLKNSNKSFLNPDTYYGAHLNKKGHQIAADAIYDWILTK